MSASRAPEHLILGAGLGGLTLALELRAAGATGAIELVDRRTDFGRDRTWCSWAAGPHPYAGLDRLRWPAWELRDHAGTARHAAASRPYRCFDSRDVYAHALARLEADPGVELRLGETVLDLDAAAPTARTDAAAYAPRVLYDALGFASPRLRARAAAGHAAAQHPSGAPRPGETWWRQGFLGWDVEVDTPIFDPGVATLMDFRLPQPDATLRFLYVLPESPTRALVEDTTFAAGGPAATDRRAVLEGWLGERTGAWTVHHEERGIVTMTDAALDFRPAPRTWAVGTAGGAVRPSSGYAFTRTLRQCRAVARAAVADAPAADAPARRPGAARAGTRRSTAMDAIFLRTLVEDPHAFPARFRALAQAVGPLVFARFMDDEATVADQARVIAGLPKVPFAAAALRR